MKEKIIYQALLKQKSRRFHMPGHKGRRIIAEDGAKALDVTELVDTDNLHNPTGILKDVQDKIAKLYGATTSHLIVNGSTCGLQAAILGAARPGESLLIPCNCHRSVYAALALGRIQGIYFSPHIDPMGFGDKITPDQVMTLLEENPHTKGLVVTSPTFFGTTSSLKSIADLLHAKGKVLIVDEAHGGHFKFSSALPEDALAQDADIVVQSVHKTLDGINQTALLHTKGERVNISRILRFLSILQTSSPSYVLLNSIELAVDRAAQEGDSIFRSLAGAYDEWKLKLGNVLYTPSSSYDKTKWLIKAPMGGESLYHKLREQGIQCELFTHNLVLAMGGIGTTLEDIDALGNALLGIFGKNLNPCFPTANYQAITYQIGCSMDIALFEKETYLQNLKDSIGKLSGDFVIPYPPGIPLLLPGSIITSKIVKKINTLKDEGCEIMGLENGQLSIIISD